MRIVALVPARKGSERVPNKSMMRLVGKPLLFYTIDAAVDSTLIEDIYISTDYTPTVLKQCLKRKKTHYVRRPDEMCTSSSPAIDYIRHFIDVADLSQDDIIVLLQPTSPLRTGIDITNAIEAYKNTDKETLVSVVKFPTIKQFYYSDGSPMEIGEYLRLEQSNQTVYKRNGSIYIFNVRFFKERNDIFGHSPYLFEMDSFKADDIDDMKDFKKIEAFVKGGGFKLWKSF